MIAFGFAVIPNPVALVGIFVDLIGIITIGCLVGMLSARFRDLRFLLPNLSMFMFFVTPIYWKPVSYTHLDVYKRQVDFLTDNLTIGMNLILAGRNADVKHFLNIGSSCMYPRNAKNPLKESAILTGELEPTNEGYAIAKIACARLCEYISRENPNLFYRTIIPVSYTHLDVYKRQI